MRILLDDKAITKTIMCLRWHAVLCTGVNLLDLETGGQSLFSVHDIEITQFSDSHEVLRKNLAQVGSSCLSGGKGND